MNIKKFFTQVPAIFLLSLSGLTLKPISALSQNTLTQEIIDDWTDEFFYRANPELSGRKIRADETEYIQEWNAIQRVIPDILIYDDNTCGEQKWILKNYDRLDREGKELISEQLNQVADAIFYNRYPEFSGRIISLDGIQLDWARIRSEVSLLHPCD